MPSLKEMLNASNTIDAKLKGGQMVRVPDDKLAAVMAIINEPSPVSDEAETPVSDDLSETATAVLSYLIDSQPEAKPTVADVTDALGVEVKGADITAAWHKFKAE